MKKIERKTQQLDASGQALGRLASRVSLILRGKDKPTFQPHLDAGDFVEVANCGQIKFTGAKLEQKRYLWHSNHPGGLKSRGLKDVFAKDPGEVLRRAVFGMLPKNKLRDQMIKRLKISAKGGSASGRK